MQILTSKTVRLGERHQAKRKKSVRSAEIVSENTFVYPFWVKPEQVMPAGADEDMIADYLWMEY